MRFFSIIVLFYQKQTILALNVSTIVIIIVGHLVKVFVPPPTLCTYLSVLYLERKQSIKCLIYRSMLLWKACYEIYVKSHFVLKGEVIIYWLSIQLLSASLIDQNHLVIILIIFNITPTIAVNGDENQHLSEKMR